MTPRPPLPDDLPLDSHHQARDWSDGVALGITRGLRFLADTFFAKRYGNRAIVLETVAAVPGMVGAALIHLRCLRWMRDDEGWIRTLMDEAENERMHLMTFIEKQPCHVRSKEAGRASEEHTHGFRRRHYAHTFHGARPLSHRSFNSLYSR